ncbi:MAG: two pore domain potassium channel family protein [Deltaproteobacteria bacterium]|nr:two pore domain potassium channel family protein [Deltaproteobacteria bacterium]MBN2688241.1 two pore domain potassium channel family protein [Deltaproteobacteria bacterium]
MQSNPIRIRLRVYLIIFFAVMMIGTVGFMRVEGLSLTDAFYFSIVTIATVGYGDIHPATVQGKLLAIVLIVTGVGTFLGVIANATELMLAKHEKEVRLEKLTMVIGTFFSEVGRHLLMFFSLHDPSIDRVRNDLIITGEWTGRNFAAVSKKIKQYAYAIDITGADMEELLTFLRGKRDFFLRLLENPALLEHETFTQLLHAVFHLTEEMSFRDDLTRLPESDRGHIAADMERAYRLLIHQWLDYMKYLKDNYPYLFSLAMRTNPFDRNASPVVTDDGQETTDGPPQAGLTPGDPA